MKNLYKIAALVLAFILSLSSMSFSLASSQAEIITSAQAKITENLQDNFETAEQNNVVAMVWMTDIDTSEAENIAMNAVTSREQKLGLNSAASSVNEFTDATDMDSVQAYIQAKRDALVELYVSHNQKLVNELMDEVNVLYISKCAPMAIVELNSANALSLAKSSDIQTIDYLGDALNDSGIEVQSVAAEDLGYETISLLEMKMITRAGTVNNSSSYGFTGDGVKIGMVETYVPSDIVFGTVNLVATNGPTSPNTNREHEEKVLEIMHSMAPDADYYAAGVGLYTGSNQLLHAKLSFIDKVEWLISTCEVNIINASYTLPFNEDTNWYNNYGTASKWVDHLSYQHNVHFVTAAGNYGSDGVLTSAMAYNAVTVGNLYANGTGPLDDDEIWSESSYYDGGEYANKPDLCAPGQGVMTQTYGSDPDVEYVFGGTSAAAPQVTAAIALLCEQRPALLTQQKTVKAILAASVNFDSEHGYVPADEEYKQYGAGLLDCVGACWVVGNYRYTTGSMPANGADRTHTFTVTSSDSRIRVALSWNIKSLSSVDGHGTITSADTALPDLNLKIKDPNGNYVKAADGSDLCSSTTNNNVEILDFVPTMTGTYTIVVMCGDNVTRTVPYSLAWR